MNPNDVDAFQTVALFIPRGWQDSEGTWVDRAEYALSGDGQTLVYTCDFRLDNELDGMLTTQAADSGVLGHLVVPDWSKAQTLDAGARDSLSHRVFELLTAMREGDPT